MMKFDAMYVMQCMQWNATGEYRDDAEAWYEVVAESGVELLEAPDTTRGRMLELFLPGKVSFVILFVIDLDIDIDIDVDVDVDLSCRRVSDHSFQHVWYSSILHTSRLLQ